MKLWLKPLPKRDTRLSTDLIVRFIGLNVLHNVVIKTERKMTMFQIVHTRGHIQVFDSRGNFLFSADDEREAREELKSYEECAA